MIKALVFISLFSAQQSSAPAFDDSESDLVDGQTCVIKSEVMIKLRDRSKVETALPAGTKLEIVHVEDFRTRVKSKEFVGMVLTEALEQSCAKAADVCAVHTPMRVFGEGRARGKQFRAKPGTLVEFIEPASGQRFSTARVRIGKRTVLVNMNDLRSRCSKESKLANTTREKEPLLSVADGFPRGTQVVFLPITHDGRANELKVLQNEREFLQKLRAKVPNFFNAQADELAWEDRFYRAPELWESARSFGKTLGVPYVIVAHIVDGEKGTQLLSVGLYESATGKRRKALRAVVDNFTTNKWSDTMSDALAKTIALLSES